MKTLLITVFVVVIAMTACSPSPEIVATAMAQTEAALPTGTPLPTPTSTATSTLEPTFTPTVTDTPSPTATATPDLRVIISDVQEILCAPEDFPPQGGYYLPGLEVSSAPHLGAKNANMKLYIQKTGRLDGWWARYRKSASSHYVGPKTIECTVEKFKTAEGARLAVLQYNATNQKFYKTALWEYYTESGINIGDESVVMVNSTYIHQYYPWGYLEIDYSYKNFRVSILMDDGGVPPEINFDAIYFVAQKILEKLKAAPLMASP